MSLEPGAEPEIRPFLKVPAHPIAWELVTNADVVAIDVVKVDARFGTVILGRDVRAVCWPADGAGRTDR